MLLLEQLVLGANVFPVFIIEHIACGGFFYGFRQQFPFRKNKVDMVIRFSFVMVQCRDALYSILFLKIEKSHVFMYNWKSTLNRKTGICVGGKKYGSKNL